MIKKMDKHERAFLAILTPVLLLFFFFNTFLLLQGFRYSFTNFRGFGSFEWVGLRNYVDLFTDSRIWKSYRFTLFFAVVCSVVVNALSLLLALALNAKIKAKTALRGVYFLPNVLGGLIVAYVFNFLFTFILPALGKAIGSSTLSTSLLSSPNTAWIAVVIVCSWSSVAINTIIYISGLQTVPEEVYEAGSIDGANGFTRFRALTFPLILPFVTINMVLCMKNFLMVFDQIVALTKGGPAQSTEAISFLIYTNGIGGNQFGFQSANAFIFFILIVTVSIIQMQAMNKKEEQL